MKLLLTILLLSLWMGMKGQKQFIVDSTWQRGMTTFIRAIEVNTGNVGFFSILTKGMGKRRNLVGLQGTYHPLGIGRRKVFFTINN